MSWYRWLACALCLAVADGAWMYPLLGLLGFVAGLGHSPVSFGALEGVMLGGVCAVALRDVLSSRWAALGIVVPVLAAASVWTGVMASAGRLGVDAGPGWPLGFISPGYSFTEAAGLLTLMAVLIWCWRHGMRRAGGGVGAPLIARGFRTGLVVLVLVLVFESAGGLDLGTRAALAPFFLASLMGMALARAPAHGDRVRAWLVLVGVVIVAVLAAGLVLGAGLVLVMRGGLGALWEVWSRLATAASRSVGDALQELLGSDDGAAAGMFLSEPMEPPQWFVLLVLLLGAALMSWAAGRLLRSPPRHNPRVVMDPGEEEREELDAVDTPGVARWLDALPGSWWPRRSRPPADDQQVGEGDGIAQVHALYLRLLRGAQQQGVVINAAETPFQRAATLARELPAAPVDELTARFVQARYGALEPPPRVIADLARRMPPR